MQIKIKIEIEIETKIDTSTPKKIVLLCSQKNAILIF